MKIICLLIFLVSLKLASYPQEKEISKDSLIKYSYTVFGLYKDLDKRANVNMGTCFFIKLNSNIYLITAQHVLYECDSNSGKLYCPYIKGIFYSSFSNDFEEFLIPPIQQKCSGFSADTDLAVIRLNNSLLGKVNTVDSFLRPPFDSIAQIQIFGQAAVGDNSTYLQIKNSHSINLTSGEFTPYNNPPVNIGDNYLDTSHYYFESKKLGVGEWLHGFSGSPVFIQDKKTKRWSMCGVLNGGLIQELNNNFLGGLMIIKQKIILRRIHNIQ